MEHVHMKVEMVEKKKVTILRERKMRVSSGITFVEMLNGMGFIAREQ